MSKYPPASLTIKTPSCYDLGSSKTFFGLLGGIDISELVNNRSIIHLNSDEPRVGDVADEFEVFKLLHSFYSLSHTPENTKLRRIFEEDIKQAKDYFKGHGFELSEDDIKKLKFKQRVYFDDEEFEKFKVEGPDLSEEDLANAKDFRERIKLILKDEDPHREHLRFNRDRKIFQKKFSIIDKENLTKALIYLPEKDLMNLKYQFDKVMVCDSPKQFTKLCQEYFLDHNSLNLFLLTSPEAIPSEPIKFPDGFQKNIFNLMVFFHDSKRLISYSDSVFCINQDDGNSLNIFDLFLSGIESYSDSIEDKLSSLGFLCYNGAILNHKKTPEQIEEIKKKFTEFFSKKVMQSTSQDDKSKFTKMISDFNENLLEIERWQKQFKSFSSTETPEQERKEILERINIFLKNFKEEKKDLLNQRGFLTYIEYFGVYDFLHQNKDVEGYKEVYNSINELIVKEKVPLPIHEKREAFRKQEVLELLSQRKLKREEEKLKAAALGLVEFSAVNPEDLARKNEEKFLKELEDEKKITAEKKTKAQAKADNKKTRKLAEAEAKENAKALANEELEKAKAEAKAIKETEELVKKISKKVQSDFEIFSPFFDELKQDLGLILPKEFGFNGSRVYRKALKSLLGTKEDESESKADFDFYCISDRIFQCCQDQAGAFVNFNAIIERFNKKDPNFQVRIKEESSNKKSINLNPIKCSLNFKLVATIGGEDFDFDLNFYNQASKLINLQWQFNGERIMASKSDDGFSLVVNNCNSEQQISIMTLVQEAQEKQEEFIFKINEKARGYLKRYLNRQGMYKYYPEQALEGSIKILAQEYNDLLSQSTMENNSRNKKTIEEAKKIIEEAKKIIEEVEKDPFLLEKLKNYNHSSRTEPEGLALQAKAGLLVGSKEKSPPR